MRKDKFIYLMILSASMLVICAAYFSITGFVKLFSGSFYSIIIMIGSLELAKIVTATYLHRHWKSIALIFKTYLLIAVLILMFTTSVGIYGFLSSAYSETSSKLSKVDSQITLLEKKKEGFKIKAADLVKSIQTITDRSNVLSAIRSKQEDRIDTLYKKGMVSSVKRIEEIIKRSDNELSSIGEKVNKANKDFASLTDSIYSYDMKIAELQQSDVKGEVGPLKYIAKLTGKDIDSVVNFFILLLVFVFDPLALLLVVGINKLLLDNKEDIKSTEKELKEIKDEAYYLKKWRKLLF